MPRIELTSQTSMPVAPPVKIEPSARPKIDRKMTEPISTAKNRNGSNSRIELEPSQLGSGGGKGSPSTTRIIRSSPASMPP